MFEPPDFEATLVALSDAFLSAGLPYMVIGGVAVLVHGVPRLTRDIDVTIDLEGSGLDRLLTGMPPGFRVLVEDPADFVRETNVLPVEGPDGTRVDLIIASLPLEIHAIRRARVERLGAAEVRVCTPEDLILHKVLSDRPTDLADVEGIVRVQAQSLDRTYLDPVIESLSCDLERPEILTFWRGLFD